MLPLLGKGRLEIREPNIGWMIETKTGTNEGESELCRCLRLFFFTLNTSHHMYA